MWNEIGEHLYQIIDECPSLQAFTSGVPSMEFSQLVTAAFVNCNGGVPVAPPPQFVAQSVEAISHQSWIDLLSLLQRWADSLYPGDPLDASELVFVALGLLWETLLIRECTVRYGRAENGRSPLKLGQ